jgi:hypothetical protein
MNENIPQELGTTKRFKELKARIIKAIVYNQCSHCNQPTLILLGLSFKAPIRRDG